GRRGMTMRRARRGGARSQPCASSSAAPAGMRRHERRRANLRPDRHKSSQPHDPIARANRTTPSPNPIARASIERDRSETARGCRRCFISVARLTGRARLLQTIHRPDGRLSTNAQRPVMIGDNVYSRAVFPTEDR
ncbi:hypothetical protein, partial [Burkholderia thailandensis]